MYWTPRGRVWEGVSPSHGGDFFGFWCVIWFKLTSILAPNVIMTAVYGEGGRGGGGGKPFLLLSNNVLDTKGEGVGIRLPRWGRFWILGY